MCPSGVTCLPTHLFSLLDTNNFISEGGRGAWDFFMSVSRESNFFSSNSREATNTNFIVWFDQTGALSYGSNTLNERMLTITPPMR
jgi:hypothetical protein